MPLNTRPTRFARLERRRHRGWRRTAIVAVIALVTIGIAGVVGATTSIFSVGSGDSATVRLAPDSDLTIDGSACAALRRTDPGGDLVRNYHCNSSTDSTTTSTTSSSDSSTTTTTQPDTGPGSADQPGPGNTGPVGPLTTLTAAQAEQVVSTNNGVLQNANVDGCLRVTGANVTIHNTRITCDGAQNSQAVSTPYPPPAGVLTIDHSQLSGYDNGDPNNCEASVASYQAYTITASNLFGCAHGIDATNRGPIVIQGNWIHDLWVYTHFADGSVTHNDGFQSMGSETPTVTVLMEGNTIDADGGTTSAIMFGEEFGVLPIVTVTGNWLTDAGGSYTIYSGYPCSAYEPRFCVSGPRIKVTNNHIGRATYGIWHIVDGSLITHACNYAMDSDTPIDDC